MIITEIDNKHMLIISGYCEIKTYDDEDTEIDYKSLVSTKELEIILEEFSQLCLKSFLFYSDDAITDIVIKTGFNSSWNFSVSLDPFEVSAIYGFIDDGGSGTIAESILNKIGVIQVEYISTVETNNLLLRRLQQIAMIERLPWPNSTN